MTKRWSAAIVVAVVTGGLLSGTGQPASASSGPGRSADGSHPAAAAYQPGVLVVGFQTGTDAGARDGVEARHGSTRERRLEHINVDVVRLPPGKDVLQAQAEFQGDGEVAFAEPNFVAHVDAFSPPNDPRYAEQYGPQKLQAVDAHGVLYPNGYPPYTGGNPSTVSRPLIAILDTGIAAGASNPDLIHKVLGVAADCTVTSTSATQSCPRSAPYDDYGHGTHVAGIAAAETNNAIGIVGVAPSAQMVSIKVLDSAGSGYYSWIASGVLCAADLSTCIPGATGHADVINMSLGGSSGSSLLQSAITTAQGKGVVVVASAGNSNTARLSYPAAYADLSVIATDRTDTRAYFSNYGGYANQVSAPGVDILSTVSTDLALPISDSSGYLTLSGTSMAAPHVAGLAGLLGGRATPVDIVRIIKQTATPLPVGAPSAYYYGAGLVNAYRAVNATAPATVPAAPAGLTAVPTAGSSTQIDLAWPASAGATSYRIERSTSPDFPPVSTTTTTSATSYPDTGLAPSTLYYYRVYAVNSVGPSTTPATASATTNPPAPQAPTGLTATTVSSSQIDLAWNASAGATSYRIERAQAASGPFAVIATPSATTYSDTGLASSTPYYYRVSAVNAGGSSVPATASATTSSGPPRAPTGLTATPATGSSSQIDLAWNASAGAASYRIERATSPDFPPVSTITAVTTTASYSDTGLAPSTLYYYRVYAVNSLGTSATASATASATTNPSAPTAPSGLTAIATSSGQIKLAWTAPAGATSYRIERAPALSGTFAVVATTSATRYRDSGLAPVTRYDYRVYAVNAGGSSVPATAWATTT